eukprot:jgi/Phyca11/536980/estExt2_fgenesh1_pg.C_PHYCAscaffold_700024
MGLLRSLVTAATSALLLGIAAPPVAAESSGVTQQHRVNLRVFFRAFCPACQWFVGDPLLELVRTEEYRNIVDLTLIPAAGMQEKQDGTITCEAGPLECTGHRWQVCVLDKDRDDVVKYLGTIACIEGDESGQVGDWNTKIKNCLTDEERVVVKECFDNRSKDLLVKMIRDERSGSVPWMPYTIVNQKVLGSATEGVPLNMLKTNICSAYTGPKSFYPAECVKLVGEQKVFAPEEAVVDKALVAAGSISQAAAAPANGVITTGVEATAKEDATEGGDGDIVVDVKEEEATPAPAIVPTTAAVVGKCMESKDNKGMTWSFIINRCFEGEAHSKMKTCYDTKSDDLLRKNVAKRQSLRVPWVPYVILNGTPLGDASHGIGLKQLMDAVCKAYSGPKNLWPQACQPKRLRDEAETKLRLKMTWSSHALRRKRIPATQATSTMTLRASASHYLLNQRPKRSRNLKPRLLEERRLMTRKRQVPP